MATGELAGVLHRLDAVVLRSVPPRSRGLLIGDPVELGGILCASLLQTIVELAAVLDDLRWEQALESALRDGLELGDLEALVPRLGQRRQPGTTRIRRVLALRPVGAPPTESLLETLMVQLVRMIAGLEAPFRQVNVYDEYGLFVARVDLAWPALGLFIELDGQQHQGQPVYDARRETAVIAATGWLVGRFTWREVVHHPVATARRLAKLVEQARRRPLVSSS